VHAWRLATLGGATTLGLDDRIGSLEPGKDADLAAFSLDNPRGVPVHHPEAAALYALRGADATFVTVAGRVLLQDGAVGGPAGDPDLPDRVQTQADALQQWLHAMQL
jgi:cytosine/adenosine deaminase-related metal-dependent hydrolase